MQWAEKKSPPLKKEHLSVVSVFPQSQKKKHFVLLAFTCLMMDAADKESCERGGQAVRGLMGRKRSQEVRRSGQESASCMWMLAGAPTGLLCVRLSTRLLL